METLAVIVQLHDFTTREVLRQLALDLAKPSARKRSTPLCPLCDGNGCAEGCGLRGGCEMAHAGPESHKVCRRCGGSGEAS